MDFEETETEYEIKLRLDEEEHLRGILAIRKSTGFEKYCERCGFLKPAQAFWLAKDGKRRQRVCIKCKMHPKAMRNYAAITPKWANLERIAEIYAEAKQRSEEEGIPYHVDHFVPVNSWKVCGLHCESNLQILPASENIRKKNTLIEDAELLATVTRHEKNRTNRIMRYKLEEKNDDSRNYIEEYYEK